MADELVCWQVLDVVAGQIDLLKVLHLGELCFQLFAVQVLVGYYQLRLDTRNDFCSGQLAVAHQPIITVTVDNRTEMVDLRLLQRPLVGITNARSVTFVTCSDAAIVPR